MPGSHSKKDKLKKRIAALDDVTSQHKKKSKDKEKLLTKQGKGVAPNYGNPSKVKKKRLKGKVSKLKSRLAGLAHSEKSTQFPVPKGKAVPLGKKLQGPTQPKPLWNVDKTGVPLTKADRMKRYDYGGTVYQDVKGNQVTQKEFEKGGPNITDKDFGRAKGKSFGAKKVEDHEHSIQFKGYRGQYYKRASLVSTQGKFAKYWLLNAKQTNGNGWGVSQQSIAKNIHKFVGRPLVVTAKSWVPDSVYGDVYEHPYLPTNDIGQVLDHQEKYRVGSIVDIIEKDGDYFANIEINQKFAHMILPPFCSPAIFQNNPAEAEGQISDWEALHLAALHEDPAYGSRIALLRGTCVGTQDQCTIQFKSAKQEAKVICTKDLKGRLATLKKNENIKQRIAALPLRGTDDFGENNINKHFTPPINKKNEVGRKLRKRRIDKTQPHIGGGEPYKRKKKLIGRTPPSVDTYNVNPLDPIKPGTMKEEYQASYPPPKPSARPNVKEINTKMPSQVPLDRAVIADALDDTSILNPEKWSDEDLKDLVEEFTEPPLTNYTHKQPLQDKIYQHHPGADIYEDAEYEALKMQRKEEAKYIENPNYKIKPITPTRDEWNRIISAKKAKLRQRLAAVPPTTKINQKDGETIANAYDKMLHDPNNPAVKESYTALIDETNAQFNELKKNGLRIDPIKEGTNPYQSGADLHNDLKKNNHLYYYPSKQGFGSSDKKFGDNPLLNESTSTYKGKKLLNNDVFRIVHDVNGHNLANSDFSPEGEHNAFLQHRKMYSPLAGKALFTETAAQANWGSWNKKSGASNRQLMKEGRVDELVFADQKVGLLPDDIINTEWHTGETRTGKLKQRLAAWAGVETGTEANVRPSAVVKKPKGKFVFNKKNIGSDLQLKSLEKMQDEAAAKNFNVSDEEIEADLDRVQTQFITEENAKKYSKLRQRLAGIQRTAVDYTYGGRRNSFGPDMDAITAFKRKQEYKSGRGVVNRKTGEKKSDWKFRTDGKSLFLHDHEIAKHVKGGIQVSNAGYDTPLTYSTLNALGINAKGTKYDPEGGLAELGSKKIDHRTKEWVFVPQNEIQSTPIVYSGGRRPFGRTTSEQSIFRNKAVKKELHEQGRRGLPMSKTNIQPKDQESINKITGLDTQKPPENLATEAHHILSYKDNPGLRGNVGNSIMLPSDQHKFLTNYEKSSPATNLKRLRQMHSKLGRLIKGKQRNAVMSKNVANIINSFKESGVSYKGIDGIWDAVEKRVLNANEEPDRERLWDTFGRRGMGFNSVTDTRGGPNDDLKLIADQLTKIEERGGNPALGFDSSYGGSLEAVDVTYGTVPEALSKLSPQQESIGYLDEDGKFTIEYNDRYLGKK